MRDLTRNSRACYCKEDECCEVEPGAKWNEDGVEEAGGKDVTVEVRVRSLSDVSKNVGLNFASSAYKAFRSIGTKHHVSSSL